MWYTIYIIMYIYNISSYMIYDMVSLSSYYLLKEFQDRLWIGGRQCSSISVAHCIPGLFVQIPGYVRSKILNNRLQPTSTDFNLCQVPEVPGSPVRSCLEKCLENLPPKMVEVSMGKSSVDGWFFHRFDSSVRFFFRSGRPIAVVDLSNLNWGL